MKPLFSFWYIVAISFATGCGQPEGSKAGEPDPKATELQKEVDRTLTLTDAQKKGAKLLSLAHQQMRNGNRSDAEATLAETEKTIAAIENLTERARLYADLAAFQAKAGKKSDAEKNEKLARRDLEKLKENPLVHVLVMTRIAFADAELHGDKEGISILEQLETETSRIKNSFDRSLAWLEISRSWRYFENKDRKKTALEKSIASAKDSLSARDAVESLSTIAEFQTLEKDFDNAKQTLELVNTFIDKIDDDIARGHAQLTLAERMASVGKGNEYEKLCKQVDEMLSRLEPSDQQRELRNRLARLRKSYSKEMP